MSTQQITASNMSTLVSEAFMKCLFKDGEDHTEHVRVEGLTRVYGLHPKRLEEQREFVTSALAELSEKFKEGYSFLCMCVNKNDEHWGEHKNCEELVVMAIGLGLMEYTMPRQFWVALPGSVPYLTIK